MNILIAIIATAFSLTSNQQQGIVKPVQESLPKNIILLIGDGMGLAHVQAAMVLSKNPLPVFQAR